MRVGAESVGAATPQLMAATDTALLDFDFMWQGLRGPAAQWETSLRARWQRHVESVEARGAAWVVLSGLRLDLWERLQSRVMSALPGWALADEGVHRATGDLAGVLEETVDEALRPRREVMQGVEVWRVTAYGRSLADRTVTLDGAASRVERALPSSLRAVAGGFAGATAVMVMSDVGEARGDASAFADIVPWALYTVAGGGR